MTAHSSSSSLHAQPSKLSPIPSTHPNQLTPPSPQPRPPKTTREILPVSRARKPPRHVIIFTPSTRKSRRRQTCFSDFPTGASVLECCTGQGLLDPEQIVRWNEEALERRFIRLKLDVWRGYEHVNWSMVVPVLNGLDEPLRQRELACIVGEFIKRFVEVRLASVFGMNTNSDSLRLKRYRTVTGAVSSATILIGASGLRGGTR
ncbi:hypothetical protein DXG01_004398 [Tephrocybe rancida]|nr:hypothetical protein DXG01_004398 [Tephrocybe rancida]